MNEDMKKNLAAFIDAMDKYTEAKVEQAKVEATPIVRIDDWFKERELVKARAKVGALKSDLYYALAELLNTKVVEHIEEFHSC